MFHQILWMNDLSTRADACLTPVRALARLDEGAVLLAHATGRRIGRTEESPRPSTRPNRAENERRIRAEAHLGQHQQQLVDAGISVRVEIGSGQPEALAARLVDGGDVDLVVAGTTGVTGLFDRLLLGSTSERLVRRTTVPLLVVRGHGFDSLSRILCPIEVHPEVDLTSVRLAARLAQVAGARLRLLSVPPQQLGRRGRTGADVDELREILEQQLGEQLDHSWELRVRQDERAQSAILEESKSVDLVVLAAPIRTGRQRLRRDVVAHVVKDCPVSVLVVP